MEFGLKPFKFGRFKIVIRRGRHERVISACWVTECLALIINVEYLLFVVIEYDRRLPLTIYP